MQKTYHSLTQRKFWEPCKLIVNTFLIINNNSTIHITDENQLMHLLEFLKQRENVPIYKAIELQLVSVFFILNIINIKCWPLFLKIEDILKITFYIEKVNVNNLYCIYYIYLFINPNI